MFICHWDWSRRLESGPRQTEAVTEVLICFAESSVDVFFFTKFVSISFLLVLAGSPSHGADAMVYLLDINQPSLPTLSVLFLCLFLSLWPFQLYSIPRILPTFLRFLTLFFWSSYFCLIDPFNYISLYEKLRQPWYNPLWLTGLKAPTN